MNEDPISDLLRSLPRENASEGFTERLMSRLDEQTPGMLHQPRLVLVAGLALVLTAWVGADRWFARQEDERRSERVQTLRAQIEQIHNDIKLLRNLAPVLYVGEDKNVDFVLDVRKLVEDEGEGKVEPASFGESDRISNKGDGRK